MASKDRFMWELVVVSIGKHSMVMGHHLCLPFQNLQLVHGAVAAVLRKRLKKLRRKCTETPAEKTLSLPFSIYGKSTVSA